MLDGAEAVIFAYGIVGRSAREAVTRARSRGVKAGLIRPVTLWPFPYEQVSDIASRVDTILVAEMNLGQLVGEVERAVAGQAEVTTYLRADGEPITPTAIVEALTQTLGERS